MHARYYSPGWGRFLSVDPHGFWNLQFGDEADQREFRRQLGEPQRWNRYSYVQNNPLRYVDPDGRESRSAIALDHDIRDLMAGNISRAEYMANIRARGTGAAIGVGAVAAVAYGPAVLAYVGDAALAVGTRLGSLAAASEMTRRVVADTNRMNHIFGNPAHKLEGLVKSFGSAERVVSAVSRAVTSLGNIQTNAHGVFSVTVKINGQDVQVTGRIIKDVIHLSNFWLR